MRGMVKTGVAADAGMPLPLLYHPKDSPFLAPLRKLSSLHLPDPPVSSPFLHVVSLFSSHAVLIASASPGLTVPFMGSHFAKKSTALLFFTQSLTGRISQTASLQKSPYPSRPCPHPACPSWCWKNPQPWGDGSSWEGPLLLLSGWGTVERQLLPTTHPRLHNLTSLTKPSSGELRMQKLKFHLVRTRGLRRFEAWSRSVYSQTCYTYCQGFLPYFYPSGPFTCIFFKTSPNFSCVVCG